LTANAVAEPENKIDFDFLKNQNSLYFTFLNQNKIDSDLKKVKIEINFSLGSKLL